MSKSSEGPRRGRAVASSSRGEREAGEPITISPEEVIQKDPRPWRRITLEGVVARTIGASAAVLALFVVATVAILRMLRII